MSSDYISIASLQRRCRIVHPRLKTCMSKINAIINGVLHHCPCLFWVHYLVSIEKYIYIRTGLTLSVPLLKTLGLQFTTFLLGQADENICVIFTLYVSLISITFFLQLTSQKDYVIHLARTPSIEEDVTQQKDVATERKSKKHTSLDTVDEHWLSIHASQVGS